MRRRLIIPLVVLAGTLPFVEPLVAQDKPMTKPAPTTGRKFAILIGINKYQDAKLADLKFAERDATELAKVLGDCGFENRTLLGSGQNKDRATQAVIEKAVAETAEKLTKQDLLLIAYSGQGVQALENDREQPYFCPCDGNVRKPKTLIAIADQLKLLGESKVGNAFLLFDACRGFQDTSDHRGESREIFERLPLRRGLSVLTATTRRSLSFESEKAGGGHGLFTHAVIKGLQGHAVGRSGTVTWEGLTTYVRETVPKLSVRLTERNGEPQNPHLVANLAGPPIVLRPED